MCRDIRAFMTHHSPLVQVMKISQLTSMHKNNFLSQKLPHVAGSALLIHNPGKNKFLKCSIESEPQQQH